MKTTHSIILILVLLTLTIGGCNKDTNISYVEESQMQTSIINNNSESSAGYTGSSEIDYAPEDLVGVELSQQNYSSHGAMFQAIYDTVIPYFVTNAYYNLSYPEVDMEYQQCLLLYVVLGIQRENLQAPFVLDEFFNQNTGEYHIPKEIFDSALNKYLGNPQFDESLLIANGYMTQDGLSYIIKLEGFGLGGFFTIGNLLMNEDKTIEMRLDVCYEPNTEPDLYVNMIFDYSSGEYMKILKVSTSQDHS